MKFSHEFQIAHSDIDGQGHANNVRYVQWIQDVAVAHWLAKASDQQKASIIWVVLRHEIDYLKAAFANETITATTWVGEPKGAKWERFTEIKRDAEVLAKAKSVWVALDSKRLRPTRIDSEMQETFKIA